MSRERRAGGGRRRRRGGPGRGRDAVIYDSIAQGRSRRNRKTTTFGFVRARIHIPTVSSSRPRSGTSRDRPTSARLATSQKHVFSSSKVPNSNSDSRLASIRGCSSFASEDVARRAGPVGEFSSRRSGRRDVQSQVSFWYRFRRSVRPLRAVVPAPNRRPAEQKTRATDADAASQATIK